MPKANVFNMAGEKIGEIELSEAIFGIEPNKSVLHDSVKNHLANCRQGTQSALTKGEVSYTTRKPWRQKGTGRARAGYAGSPVWYHGGVAFAPKPRSYAYRDPGCRRPEGRGDQDQALRRIPSQARRREQGPGHHRER